ncbi:hypothetical protein Trisim1_009707 [Trichoderma cf. simile WF8]
MESSDRSFEDWRASSPDCPSVASEYPEPLESSSDTREEEIADQKSAPSHGLILPSKDRKTGGHAYGYESGQKPYADAVTTQRTTQSALEATGRQSIQRLALRLAKDNVTKLVAKQVGMEAKKSFRATRRPLFLAQTECEIGFQVTVYLCMDEEDSASEESAPELGMNIIFDPKSDAIMLFNRTKGDEQQFITVRRRPISNAWIPIRIGSSERAMLDPASYSISWSDKHILDMTVFPRRYMSLVPRHLKPLTKNRKRALEELASQSSPPPVKKPKAKEASEGSSVSTAIQIDDDVVAVSGPTVSSSLRSKFNLINDLCHPMEALKLHDAIKVVNSIEEEDYTLTRKADIAVHRKSLVFKARHSDAAGELIVVKLLRSHSEIDHKDDKVMGIDVVGERWLKEVKNNYRVSEHRAIASIYGFDARFLTLYMEYIDAPGLDTHINGEGNPYCTLDSKDARQVLLDMTDAINFVHRKGVIHNDIKPSNILYSKERGAVLIDFGLATTRSTHNGGTRWYIPPEYGSDGKRGAPGDIFALGVVLLFLLRKIPLPELQSPPLVWDIRRRGVGNKKAAAARAQWESIVNEAAGKLKDMNDVVIHPKVLKVISRMVAPRPKKRATGDQIVEKVKEYDDVGSKYVFTY